jgi:hypothetical protein
VFFVWESGAISTIRNNLWELGKEPVFHNLLGWIVKHAFRGAAADGADKIGRDALSPVMKNGLPSLPAGDDSIMPKAPEDIDKEAIAQELQGDNALMLELAALQAGGAALQPDAAKAFGIGKLELGWAGDVYQVAELVANVALAVIRRYGHGRDHGPLATCLEELLRAIKVAGSPLNEWGKALEWNRMKQDCADAFGDAAHGCAGTLLLKEIAAQGVQLKRITLVGHSTGSIYIANWLEHCAAYLGDLRHDIVFLAPAITYDAFENTLEKCAERIGNVRMFAMRDESERQDQLIGDDDTMQGGASKWRFVYPSSLLYLVSGALESRIENGKLKDEADVPLLGMQRFFKNTKVYDQAGFPSIQKVVSWLDHPGREIVWSPTQDGASAGFACGVKDHGGFDDDRQTWKSLAEVLRHGWPDFPGKA